MLIKKIDVKGIMTKSNLPVADYSVNPYVGCSHSCKYCYASFMKRFTNHPEPWGEFVDVKYWPTIQKPERYAGKEAFFGSVTDCYQPCEEKYGRTRSLLEQLQGSGIRISIATKSDLVLRDLDLIKTWNVYVSMTERKAGDLRNVYEYAANGQLTAAISNGMDYRYSYDKDGLLTAKKASGRTLLGYTYDELVRKTSQIDISGRKVKYQFDQSNHLLDIKDEFDRSIVKFDRDADGAVKKITHANGMWQDIHYDADKNITSLTVATPDKILA